MFECFGWCCFDVTYVLGFGAFLLLAWFGVECLCNLVTVFGGFGGCLVFCSLAVGGCWWRC